MNTLHDIRKFLSPNGKVARECNNCQVNEFSFLGEQIFLHDIIFRKKTSIFSNMSAAIN
eukprot:UN24050